MSCIYGNERKTKTKDLNNNVRHEMLAWTRIKSILNGPAVCTVVTSRPCCEGRLVPLPEDSSMHVHAYQYLLCPMTLA
jgi:hypothetical protein